MNTTKPKLLFVSPVFLFPNDSGGKIRTSNILRGLKGGKFHVTLVSPGSSEQVKTGDKDIASVCDEYLCWTPRQPKPKWLRFFDLFDSLPINVVADRTEHGIAAVGRACKEAVFDLVVFDFVHLTSVFQISI